MYHSFIHSYIHSRRYCTDVSKCVVVLVVENDDIDVNKDRTVTEGRLDAASLRDENSSRPHSRSVEHGKVDRPLRGQKRKRSPPDSVSTR